MEYSQKIDSYIYAESTVRQMLWVDYDNNGSLDLFVSYDWRFKVI